MGERPKGSIAAWWAANSKQPRDRFLGAADVARLLGVTRQRVSQLKKEPTFPHARMNGWGTSVWDAAGIECWVAAHRPARLEASGRFGMQIGPLLLAAEESACRLRTHWVDSSHLWLAVAEGAAGSDLARTVDSMGVTVTEISAQIASLRSSDERPKHSLRMTPHFQTFLVAADRNTSAEGRDEIRPIDLLFAFIDAPETSPGRKRHPADHLLAWFGYRGLDIAELRRRLVAVDLDPSSIGGFEQRRLRRLRVREPKKPAWLDLAPNPLGHDPWTRRPWGAAFAVTRDGRHLEVDGEHWFFTTDGDGFYVRAADGRPVGYRYRVLTKAPKRDPKPVNGFMEILPLPPFEMHHWPDHRFGEEDVR